MKQFVKIAALFFVIGLLIGCHEHEEVPIPGLRSVSVAFDSTHVNVREDQAHKVTIALTINHLSDGFRMGVRKSINMACSFPLVIVIYIRLSLSILWP